MRADKLLETGDMDGKAVWVKIMKAAEELLSDKQTDGATIQLTCVDSPCVARVF